MACLPSEGTMEEKARASYVSAVEGAFIKAGHKVADRQRLEKLIKEMSLQQTSDTNSETDATAKAGKVMKVDYLVAIIVDDWDEEKLNTVAMEKDRKNDTMKPTEAYYMTIENVRLTLKVIEVETSIIIAQENVQDSNIRGYSYRKDMQSKLATKVVNKVMKDVKKQLRKKK